MGLYWSFFAQFLGKIIPPPHSHTPQVLVKHNSSSASFDRQIACMVHTFMQFVAHHETLHQVIAQNETITSNHDSSKLITKESSAITIYSTIPNRWNNQQSQE